MDYFQQCSASNPNNPNKCALPESLVGLQLQDKSTVRTQRLKNSLDHAQLIVTMTIMAVQHEHISFICCNIQFNNICCHNCQQWLNQKTGSGTGVYTYILINQIIKVLKMAVYTILYFQQDTISKHSCTPGTGYGIENWTISMSPGLQIQHGSSQRQSADNQKGQIFAGML